MNAAYGYPDHEHAERVSIAMDAITSDERECQEFADELLEDWRDELGVIMTGAYGYADEATKRFRAILQDCEKQLVWRAERNLNEGRD